MSKRKGGGGGGGEKTDPSHLELKMVRNKNTTYEVCLMPIGIKPQVLCRGVT